MKVTYIDHMGSDLSVVNAARVSFNKTSDWVENSDSKIKKIYRKIFGTETKTLSSRDKNLIYYLARGMSSKEFKNVLNDIKDNVDNDIILKDILWKFRRTPTHEAPFGHCFVSLHVRAPVFVARQTVKHEYLRMSEVSRRYVNDEPEFYFPYIWRYKAENVKQGSSEEGLERDGFSVNDTFTPGQTYRISASCYRDMMEKHNICPELSRIVLPQAMYTEWYWSGSLDAFANMYNLRSDSHAQKEVQDIANQVDKIMMKLYPVSWEALTRNI